MEGATPEVMANANVKVTVETVRSILTTRMESEVVDEILAILKTMDGKPLTKRILPKLPGDEERWCITQSAGMTSLEEKSYRRTSGNTGVSLLMAYATANVVIDAKFVEERNPAWFEGRRERNAERRRALEMPAVLALAESLLNDVIRARAALAAAEARLSALTSYKEPLSADRYAWEELTKSCADILLKTHGVKMGG
jgi:hypothetical protein